MWFVPLILSLWSLLVPAGDAALYREVGGGTSITSSGAIHTYDTVDEEAGASFSQSGGEVTVREACRVLYFGGTELTVGAAETGDLRFSLDPNTGTYAIEPIGWCMSYASNANGINVAALGVAGVVDCVANAKLKLTSFSLSTNNWTESANRTYLHLFRLPADCEVFYGYRNSNLATVAAALLDLPWNAEVVKDSHFTHSTSTAPEEITWTGGSVRALLIVCVTFNNANGSPDAYEGGFQVLKNGTALNFTQSTNFAPGTGGDVLTTCRLCVPIDLATNDVIKVQVKQFVRAGTQQIRVNQNRAGIAIVTIPDRVNWIQIRHASNQGADNAAATDFASNTEGEKDSGFTHSTVTNNNRIQMDRVNHLYCLGYHLNVDRTSSSTSDDVAWDVAWQLNNGSNLNLRGFGAFTQGAVSALDYKDGSYSCGVMYRAAASGDFLELRTLKFGSGADASAVWTGGAAVGASLVWAFDIRDLRPITAACAAGSADKSAGKVTHEGRGQTVGGSAERAIAGVTHGARARGVPGGAEKATGAVSHGSRALAAAGSADKGAATVAHGGRARSADGAAARGVGKVSHGGRAVDAAGAVEKAAASVTHVGVVTGRTAAGAVSKAAATVTHGARSATAAGAADRGTGKVAHGARASGAPGAAEKAAPSVTHLGQASARTAAGAVSKAAAKVTHGARGRAAAGAAERGAAKVQHGARASTAAGSADKAAGKKTAKGRAATQAGLVGRGIGKVTHAGRALGDPQSGSLEQGKPKVSHRARARTVAGAVDFSKLTPTEVLGFYTRTSKKIRQALRLAAGSLPIQFPNLPFSAPAGIAWLRAAVNFGYIEETSYGAGAVSYIVPGELVLELRGPMQRGEKTLMDLADDLAATLQMRESNGIVYDPVSPVSKRDVGEGRYVATFSLPFRAEDSRFARGGVFVAGADDFAGAEASVRALFRAALPDVVVSYDNLPPTTGATWVRLLVHDSPAWNVDGVRREVGVMEAQVRTPAGTGEKAALMLADRIVEAFRFAVAGDVTFSAPYLKPSTLAQGEWVQPVFCPWSVDHA